MQFIKLSSAIVLSVAFAGVHANPEPSPANNNNNNNNAGGNNAGSGATGTTLSADAIQSGSFVDGSKEVGAAEVGQALSATSQNNFINNCSGKTLTNGLQITTGSCNGIPMGDIPAKTAMVSSVITNPQTGGKAIQADKTFNITVQMSNLVAGSFTNADATYYAAPQALSGGKVVGHTHVTVQDMGNSMNPTQALDPTKFAFFKGINDAGDGNGLLSAEVTGGLPAGNYRVCTMASSSNHQPVLMPVAQRGTADDCTKFVVSGNGNTENAAADDGSKGQAAAAAAASAVANGAGNDDPNLGKAASSTASSAAKATSASNSNTGKGQNANGQAQNANAQGQNANANAQGQKAKGQGAQRGQGGFGRGGKMRFARRQFIS
ncbi:hypothetical protein PVAG01_08178 [Phlyctema vagabunda]|uniref:Ribosomal protein s17 n=1 Tax=Phlyctema vagabunda TaxID=108571 RepID=A0ABR4P8N9_9HELO